MENMTISAAVDPIVAIAILVFVSVKSASVCDHTVRPSFELLLLMV